MNQATNKVTLITFHGCPHAEEARQMLRKIGVPFEERIQDELPEDDPAQAYSSPSILVGQAQVLGSKLSGSGGGCSIALPSIDELRILIRRQT